MKRELSLASFRQYGTWQTESPSVLRSSAYRHNLILHLKREKERKRKRKKKKVDK